MEATEALGCLGSSEVYKLYLWLVCMKNGKGYIYSCFTSVIGQGLFHGELTLYTPMCLCQNGLVGLHGHLQEALSQKIRRPTMARCFWLYLGCHNHIWSRKCIEEMGSGVQRVSNVAQRSIMLLFKTLELLEGFSYGNCRKTKQFGLQFNAWSLFFLSECT